MGNLTVENLTAGLLVSILAFDSFVRGVFCVDAVETGNKIDETNNKIDTTAGDLGRESHTSRIGTWSTDLHIFFVDFFARPGNRRRRRHSRQQERMQFRNGKKQVIRFRLF